MQRLETKSKYCKRKNENIEDVDTNIPQILARRSSISEATEQPPNKKPAKTKNLDTKQRWNQKGVFTKEQETTLRKHIIKCCQTRYYKNTTIRKMIYEYANKIPNCKYPQQWDTTEMACVDWFLKFRRRHPGLKKTLTKKSQHSCICIMGCHMGPEGKQALKELEAKVLIARVYHYLNKEYEYMNMCNDPSLLVNILRRTAEATGVCEQTITKILEEDQNRLDLNDIPTPPKTDIPTPPKTDIPTIAKKKRKKKEAAVIAEHNYNCNGESSNVETVDEDSSSSNNVPYSDFERLQQDATSIKSVMVEILDEDFDEQNCQQNSQTSWTRTDSMEEEPNKLDEKQQAKNNKIRIIFADDEANIQDLPRNNEDTAMRIDSTDFQYSKRDTGDIQHQADMMNAKGPASDDPPSLEDEGNLVIDETQTPDACVQDQVATRHSKDQGSDGFSSLKYEGELVIDEFKMNLDYNPDGRSHDIQHTENMRSRITEEPLPIILKHETQQILIQYPRRKTFTLGDLPGPFKMSS